MSANMSFYVLYQTSIDLTLWFSILYSYTNTILGIWSVNSIIFTDVISEKNIETNQMNSSKRKKKQKEDRERAKKENQSHQPKRRRGMINSMGMHKRADNNNNNNK